MFVVAYIHDRVLPSAGPANTAALIALVALGALAVVCLLFLPLLTLGLHAWKLIVTITTSAPLLKRFFLPLDDAPIGQPVFDLSTRQMAALEA
jgi:hypothetical protein